MVIVITGATDGIGKETARQLAGAGRVLVHGRSREKASAACAELAQATGHDSFEPVVADLARRDEVKAMAETIAKKHPAIDVLINNAGVYMKERQLAPDGSEMTLAVNHLAPFALTHWLLPALTRAKQGRIINVASQVHTSGEIDFDDLDGERQWSGYSAYANSKLMNVLFTNELARRLGKSMVTVNALHPGVIGTKLLRDGFGAGGAPLKQGAETSVRLATDPELATVTGRYFANAREAQSSSESHDIELARRLYEVSCERTGVAAL